MRQSRFKYKKVDEIKKGLKLLFNANIDNIENPKLKVKAEMIRKIKTKISDVKIYYSINSNNEPNKECVESKKELVFDIFKILEANCAKDIKIDFLFFGAKEIYEKKVRNENPLSKKKDVKLKYSKNVNEFVKFKEENFLKGKMQGYVVTVNAIELKKFYQKEGDWIFHYNIREYQGANKTNKGVEATIKCESRNKFWFLNNGVTLVCEDATGSDNDIISFAYPQIVNGQQTIKTISAYEDKKLKGIDVLLKIYITDNEEFFSDIAMATNSQTKVDYEDLSSNRTEQYAIKLIFDKYDYYYKNKKGKSKKKYKIGTNSKLLGRIAMSTILESPSKGRRTTRSDIIFNEENYPKLFNVNPYLLLLSFLIYKYCEKQDFGIKDIKRVTTERNVKHFGQFHLTYLIWELLKNNKFLDKDNEIIKLIEENSFEKYYKIALKKLSIICKKEKQKDKDLSLKDFFSEERLDILMALSHKQI